MYSSVFDSRNKQNSTDLTKFGGKAAHWPDYD